MKPGRKEATSARVGMRRGKAKGAPESPPRTRSSPSRSPARTRRTSPPAVVPAATPRSPTLRSPSRRSPARNATSKFPARKSPSRVAETKKSPSRRTAAKEEPLELKHELSEPIVRIVRPRRSEYSIKDLTTLRQVEVSVGDRVTNGLERKERLPRAAVAPQLVRRTSARLRDSASQPSGSSRLSESTSRSLDIPLDDDSQDEVEQIRGKTSAVRKLATPMCGFNVNAGGNGWEFGGRFGAAALVVLLPAWVFTILALCARSCSFRLPQLAVPSSSSLFSRRSCALVVGQIILQTVLHAVNVLGRCVDRMDDSGKKQYFNGLFASLFTICGVFALNFFNILSVEAILDEYLRMAVLLYILATLLAVGLFVKTRKMPDDKLNPYGNSGNILYDFWMGRELFPQLARIDVKILLHRICNINGLIISMLIFTRGITLPELETVDTRNYKDLLTQLRYDPTLLTVSLMQLTYFLNLILNEHKITSTFAWQSEGVGYMQTVSIALYPFYFLTISKFVLESKSRLSTNVLIATSLLYLVGFAVYLISNSVKYEFRKNPLQTKLSHLEVLPTFLGKRLIVSGLWGTMRHPNYFGDIALHLALAVPGVLAGCYVAALPVVTAVAVLIHRASRDDARCRRRYGAAWQRYSKKVPSMLLPKVY